MIFANILVLFVFVGIATNANSEESGNTIIEINKQIKQNNPNKAISTLKNIISKHPSNIEYYELLVNLLFSQKTTINQGTYFWESYLEISSKDKNDDMRIGLKEEPEAYKKLITSFSNIDTDNDSEISCSELAKAKNLSNKCDKCSFQWQVYQEMVGCDIYADLDVNYENERTEYLFLKKRYPVLDTNRPDGIITYEKLAYAISSKNDVSPTNNDIISLKLIDTFSKDRRSVQAINDFSKNADIDKDLKLRALIYNFSIPNIDSEDFLPSINLYLIKELYSSYKPNIFFHHLTEGLLHGTGPMVRRCTRLLFEFAKNDFLVTQHSENGQYIRKLLRLKLLTVARSHLKGGYNAIDEKTYLKIISEFGDSTEDLNLLSKYHLEPNSSVSSLTGNIYRIEGVYNVGKNMPALKNKALDILKTYSPKDENEKTFISDRIMSLSLSSEPLLILNDWEMFNWDGNIDQKISELCEILANKRENINVSVFMELNRLGKGAKKVLPILEKIYIELEESKTFENDTNKEFILSSLEILNGLGKDANQITPFLLQKLNGDIKDQTVKNEMIATLGYISDNNDKSIELLETIAKNNPPLRELTITAIGHAGPNNTKAVNFLCQMLDNKDSIIETINALELSDNIPAPCTDKLSNLLRESITPDSNQNIDVNLCVNIIHFFAKIKLVQDNIIETLIKSLHAKDEMYVIGNNALYCLWKLGPSGPDFHKQLAEMLQSKNDIQRMHALTFIIESGDAPDSLIKYIISNLKEYNVRDGELSSLAAWTLGKLGKKATVAIPDLELANKSGNKDIVKSSTIAIENINKAL